MECGELGFVLLFTGIATQGVCRRVPDQFREGLDLDQSTLKE
jgi:hypothetical protein